MNNNITNCQVMICSQQDPANQLPHRDIVKILSNAILDTVIVQVLRQLIHDAYRVPFQFNRYLPNSTGIVDHVVKNLFVCLAPGFSEVLRELKLASQVMLAHILGIYRYESVDISPESRGFQCRQDLEDYLYLRQLRVSVEQSADLADIVPPLMAFSSDNPYLCSRQSRLLFQIAQQLEKSCGLEQALLLYQESNHGEARWRQIRVLEQLGRDSEAHDQALAFSQEPGSDEESQRLERALTRLRRKLGLPTMKRAKAVGESRIDLVLPMPAHGCVEIAVRDHLQQDDAPVHYVENTLICSLFGLLCWEAIFAPLPGAFFHPFHSGPVDLHSPDFYARRQPLFERCLQRLEQPGYGQLIKDRYQEKLGLQSPFVFWGMLDEARLELALQCIPAAHLHACFTRLLRDLKANRAGMPDLIQFYPQEQRYRMIEVKGPGDRLQDNQKRWLAFAAEQGIPVEVCYVSWDVA